MSWHNEIKSLESTNAAIARFDRWDKLAELLRELGILTENDLNCELHIGVQGGGIKFCRKSIKLK